MTLDQRTTDLDELLYWIFQDVTFSMACSYELAHRIPGMDSRWLRFQHQLELLQTLHPGWKERCAADLAEVPKNHPFVDHA